jgi:hypothetical protein
LREIKTCGAWYSTVGKTAQVGRAGQAINRNSFTGRAQALAPFLFCRKSVKAVVSFRTSVFISTFPYLQAIGRCYAWRAKIKAKILKCGNKGQKLKCWKLKAEILRSRASLRQSRFASLRLCVKTLFRIWFISRFLIEAGQAGRAVLRYQRPSAFISGQNALRLCVFALNPFAWFVWFAVEFPNCHAVPEAGAPFAFLCG